MSIKVTIKPFTPPDIVLLSEKWQHLEKSSDCSVFLSWQWIKHWLSVVQQSTFLIEATREGDIVGLGLFVEKKRFAFGIIPITQWWLHRTGEQAQDQMWMEYNDFLLSTHDTEAVRRAMTTHLHGQCSLYDECVIGLSMPDVLTSYDGVFQASKNVVLDKGYLVNYSAMEGDYSSSCLSRNTRGQLNKAEKRLHEQGELTLSIVKDTFEKQAELEQIKSLHTERWKNTNTPSGFINPVFDEFFSQLYSHSCSQVMVFSVNTRKVAFLVNFIHKGQVYFYLSAIEKNSDKKVKLGMLAHKKAIEYYAKQGMVSYDFLAGDSQYKQSLSNQHYLHNMKSFYKSSMVLTFEQTIKTIILKLSTLVKKTLGR